MKKSIRIFAIVGAAIYVVSLIISIIVGFASAVNGFHYEKLKFLDYVMLTLRIFIMQVFPTALRVAVAVWLFIISKPRKKACIPEIVILVYLGVISGIIGICTNSLFQMVVYKFITNQAIGFFSMYNYGEILGSVLNSAGFVGGEPCRLRQ